jgi:serine/threonine protein kinase, bacterial
MPLSAGQTFAGYRIVRLIGSGGMGEVYLAEHPRLPRRDALKVLSADISGDPEYRARFDREADLASALWHQNIVSVHDRGEHDGQLWISMDYVEGMDAARLLAELYPAGMPVDRVVRILTAVASALDYAHKQGLLHRDVKPANIILTHGGDDEDEQRILLADFGIARNIDDISGLTATNMTVGTFAYCPPEQLMGEEVDGRADQYALAATAYHLLTGRRLFPHSNPAVVISRQLNENPPALADTRPDLATLDSALATALAKNPADRFARCTDFARTLGEASQPALRADAISSTMPAPKYKMSIPPTAASTRQPNTDKKQHHRYRILLGAAVAVATVAGIGVTSHLHQPNHNTAPAIASLPPTAVLDGTYRIDFDYTNATTLGAPDPPPAGQPQTESVWSAYRSTCTPAGCVAAGMRLDDKNHQVASTPPATSEFHFADKRWHRVPVRARVQLDECSVDKNKKVPGSHTILVESSWEPQSNGNFRGLRTTTVLTSECGFEGQVNQTPFVVTRAGDMPPGINLPAPADATSASAKNPPAASVAGPTLDGTFRVDYDGSNSLYDGQRSTSPSAKDPRIEWWAFHSSCTPAGCVATGAKLDEVNHREAQKGRGDVLRFDSGHWQDSPFTVLIPCNVVRVRADLAPTANFTAIQSWSWDPQPDGTLKGEDDQKLTDSDCGDMPYREALSPFVATRVGDVPPGVVLADPALFE